MYCNVVGQAMRKLLVFSVFTLISSPASAGFETGNSLLAECSVQANDSTYFHSASGCLSYVVGIADMIELQQRMKDVNGQTVRQFICVPSGVTKGQVRDITVQYLSNNPDKRHFNAAALVWNALLAAFPCSQ
jgi:hypothetical protein